MLRNYKLELSSCGLIALIFFIFGFLCLPLAEISGSSEAREAHIVSVITDAFPNNIENVILPTRNGLVASKPPLSHWIGSSLCIVSGECSPFVARLPSLLFGTLLLFITLIAASRLQQGAPPSEIHERDLQILTTALVLTSTYGFTSMATLSMVDMTYAFFVDAAVLTALSSLRYHPRGEAVGSDEAKRGAPISDSSMNLFFVCCGLATLGKGPIGLVLPVFLTFIAIAYLFSVRTAFRTFIAPRLGWILFILIAFPWYFFATFLGSSNFVERQFIFENIERAIGGENINTGPWWFYVPAFFKFAAPWSFLTFFAAILEYQTGGFKKRSLRNACFLLTISGLVFFSLFAGKRHAYLLPLYPFLALYVGWTLRRMLTQSQPQIWFCRNRLMLGCAFVMAAVLAFIASVAELSLVVPFTANRKVHLVLSHLQYSGSDSRAIAIMALLVGSAWWIVCNRRNISQNIRNAFVTYILLNAVFFLVVMNIFSVKAYFKSHAEVASRVAQIAGSEMLYVVRDKYDETFDPVLYYLYRNVTLVSPTDLQSVPLDGLILARRDSVEGRVDIIENIPSREQLLRPNDGKVAVLFRRPQILPARNDLGRIEAKRNCSLRACKRIKVPILHPIFGASLNVLPAKKPRYSSL